MKIERTGVLKLGEMDATIIGRDIEIGQQAPEFTAHTQDYSLVPMLEHTAGKVRVIAAVPSLQTSPSSHVSS